MQRARRLHPSGRLLAAGLLSLLCSCPVFTEVPSPVLVLNVDAAVPDWQPIFLGVDYAAFRIEGDEPLAVLAARVDLQAEGISFLVTPDNGDRPMETDGRKTSSFLREHRCQVAVNASPFKPVGGAEGDPKEVLGLAISRGTLVSPSNDQYDAILIDGANRVTFDSPPFELDDVQNAAAGFHLLLQYGKNLGHDDERHPRTAVGVSEDGRYLYLMVIDGRQSKHSIGASTKTTARWLQCLGAHDGLNLDGGGSTTLVIEGPDGKPAVLNRPIHGNFPGMERVNANNLGVFAKPLP